jgi:D-arabinose 1-dehydrogenase-like Zn-dependent alcohol dehydrogenase
MTNDERQREEELGATPLKEGSDVAMIVITDSIEHEDGSATYTFDMDERSEKKITELGLEFILTCAAYKLDIQEALEVLRDYGETVHGPYTPEEVGEILNENS